MTTRIEICCDNTCENYGVAQEIELTDAEVAQMEADRIAFEAAKAAEDAAKAEAEAAKASAQAKLAALGLTDAEIAALSK
jgi:hypothetical protein